MSRVLGESLPNTQASNESSPLLESGLSTNSRRIRPKAAPLAAGTLPNQDLEAINSRSSGNRISARILIGLAKVLAVINIFFMILTFFTVDTNYSYYWLNQTGSNILPLIFSFLALLINISTIIDSNKSGSTTRFAIWTSWTSLSTLVIIFILFLAVGDIRRRESTSTGVTIGLLVLSVVSAIVSATVSEKLEIENEPEEEPESNLFQSASSFILNTVPSIIFHLVVLVTLVILLISLILRSIDSSLAIPGHLYYVNPWTYNHGHLGNHFVDSKGRDFQVHLDCRGLQDRPRIDSSSRIGADRSKLESSSRTGAFRTILMESPQGVPGAIDAAWALDYFANGLNIGDASIRICYWDRPGYGFSDNSPTSSIPLVVAALSESLEKAGEYARLPAPRPELARSGFILVSREYGSLSSMLFAARNPQLIHSVLLLSPTPPSLCFNPLPRSIGQKVTGFFTTRLFEPIWIELSIKRFWFTVINGFKNRKARVLSTADEHLRGEIYRSKIQEAGQRSPSSLSARVWNGIKNKYPQSVPTILLSSNQSDSQQEVIGIIGKGLIRWEKEWNDVNGCNGLGRKLCENSLQELVLLD